MISVTAILIRGKAGDWLVFFLTLVPFVLAIDVSLLGRNILLDRYLLFIHPFILVGFARLVGKLPGAISRNVVMAIVLVNALALYPDFVGAAGFAGHPGARAAAEYIAQHRQPGEKVIVESPLLYLPLIYYVPRPDDWYVYNDGKPFPHYAGPQVLRLEEIIGPEQVRAMRTGKVWVVGTSGGWPTEKLEVPSHWRQRSEESVREVFGTPIDYVIRLYDCSGESSAREE